MSGRLVISMDNLKPVLDDLRKNVDRKATDSRNVRDEWNGKTTRKARCEKATTSARAGAAPP